MIRNFDPSNMPLRGRALWKVNDSLLDDQFFCTNMTLFINDLLVRRNGHSSYRDFWQTLKENIKTYILSYSKHKCRDAPLQKVLLTNPLIYLNNLLTCGISFLKTTFKMY